jgi:tetratricopeptide (TPR) repeat protein
MLVIQGDYENAVLAAGEAVRLEPKDAQFRVTRAQLLGQVGRAAEAIEEAGRAADDAAQRPHIKARAQCLMGDLVGSGVRPDYKKAIEYHTQAIRTAALLTSNPHPAIRVPAKEVLIDANLGAAHDIAWGNWKQKGTATQVWLKRAAEFADDLAQNDGGTAEHRFRVASRALAAYVGMRGELDPTEWASRAESLGREMVAAAEDGPQKQQVQWDAGMALYDAVQIYQIRGQRDPALQYGQQAAEFLEQSGRDKSPDPADAYLLGRLYFRLGSIHAIPEKDHKAAVVWFDKAIPVLERSARRLSLPEQGRLGETLVSMGVSYWETSSRAKAVQLTQEGLSLLDKAVKGGAIPRSALQVPQSNLATMQREMDRRKPADFGAGRIENASQKMTVLR